MNNEFSIKYILQESWRITRENLKDLILVFFIGYGVVYFVLAWLISSLMVILVPDEDLAQSVGSVLISLINAALLIAVYRYFLLVVRGEKVKWTQMYALVDRFRFWGNIIVSLLIIVAVGVGFILFVIPGIYLGIRLGFAPWLIIDKGEGIGIIDALRQSWSITEGMALKLFVFYLVFFLLYFVALIPIFLTLGLGLFVWIPYVFITQAFLYEYLLTLRSK